MVATKALKLTPDRESVLKILKENKNPMGAYEILDHLKKVKSNAVPMTVYRALDYLESNGLIHKLENLNAYTPCSHPNHNHICQFIICDSCNTVVETCDRELTDLVRKKADQAGFAVSSATLEISAICTDCQQSKPAHSPT